MAQLRQDYEKFTERSTQIIVVGPEGPRQFKNYFGKENLPFIGLPNMDSSVLKLYGQKVDLFKLGRMPAQVIIDRQGIVCYVHYGHSMSDIPENQELLNLLDKINLDYEKRNA
jgi:peroxiredoxin Q/BCP